MALNTELFELFAHQIALPETLKSAILGLDGLPEDFDATEALQKYEEQRNGFYKDRHRSTIIEEYKDGPGKDAYIATVKPLRARLIKGFGLTQEQVEGIDITDIKAVIDLASKEADKKANEAGSKSTAAFQSEFNELKKNYANLFDEHESLKGDVDARINTIQHEADVRVHSYKVDQAFGRFLSQEIFDWNNSLGNVSAWIRAEMQEKGYKVDFVPGTENLMIFDSEGNKAFTLDKRDQYSDLESAINDFGHHLNLFKVSNGGKDHDLNQPRVINGKKMEYSGTNFLRQQLGG
ncbi:MAG: hypothetical protein ACWA44_02455 [Thiotrichales bacterium]